MNNHPPSSGDEQIIDLEEHAKSGKPPPPAKRYQLRIDREKYVVEVTTLTGTEILKLANKTPECFRLSQKHHGGKLEAIGPNDKVDLTMPGIERFQTVALDCTNGGAPLRCQFPLSEEDRTGLIALGLTWETILEGPKRWLLVHGFSIPFEFGRGDASVALDLPPGYPDVQIDMAYFSPALARPDGRAIPALAPTAIDGKQWQRWSRHRTGAAPWRPGIDNVVSHLLLVRSWLDREFEKKAA